MLQISVTMDDITDDAFNIVAAALFEGVERAYTTDWNVTGPIIQALGVSINYQGDSDDVKLVSRHTSENDHDWMATYGDAITFSASPLVAAIKAIATHRLGDIALPFSHKKVVGMVKDEYTIVASLLEGSNCHDVEPGDRINVYEFVAKDGADEASMFQDLANLVGQLESLTIVETQGAPNAAHRLIVEHS